MLNSFPLSIPFSSGNSEPLFVVPHHSMRPHFCHAPNFWHNLCITNRSSLQETDAHLRTLSSKDTALLFDTAAGSVTILLPAKDKFLPHTTIGYVSMETIIKKGFYAATQEGMQLADFLMLDSRLTEDPAKLMPSSDLASRRIKKSLLYYDAETDSYKPPYNAFDSRRLLEQSKNEGMTHAKARDYFCGTKPLIWFPVESHPEWYTLSAAVRRELIVQAVQAADEINATLLVTSNVPENEIVGDQYHYYYLCLSLFSQLQPYYHALATIGMACEGFFHHAYPRESNSCYYGMAAAFNLPIVMTDKTVCRSWKSYARTEIYKRFDPIFNPDNWQQLVIRKNAPIHPKLNPEPATPQHATNP